MKSLRTVLFVTLFLITFPSRGWTQEEPGPMPGWGQRGMGPERLERYKRMRLIEVLELNEEDAAKFVAKHKKHQNIMHELMQERMKIIDELEQSLRDKSRDNKKVENLFARLDESDQKMFNERKRYQADIKSMLTTEQMVKFYVFDRNFNRELREAVEQMKRERRRR